ncbi:MAG: hypothetical protein M0D55_14675 [Elusimicrobiota bacterium]|nr:MAG: hypothetical protein M0D55_14675 [Elusimicrobiota bacterium]
MRLAPLLLVATTAFGEPAPELIRLQGVLEQEQKAGAAQRPDYPAFVAKFRQDLDAALKGAPQTAENESLHALVLSRLDATGRAEAVILLSGIEVRYPDDPTPTKARGRVHFEAQEFRLCQTAAESVLKKNADLGEPSDQEAVRLLHSCKGRSSAVPEPDTSNTSNQSPETKGSAGNTPGRPPIVLSAVQARRPVNVPGIDAEASRSAGPGIVDRVTAYAKDSSARAQERAIQFFRARGLRPEEDAAAIKGAKNGALVGTAVGVGIGVVSMGPCAPWTAYGLPYPVCVGVAGTVGIAIFAPTAAFVGGAGMVGYTRATNYALQSGGFSAEPENPE